MKKAIIASVLGLSIVAGVAVAGGGHCNKGDGDGHGGWGRGHHGMSMLHSSPEKVLKKMQRRFDLTDDQVTQLTPILSDYQSKKKAQMEQHMQARLETMKADQAALRQQVEGILSPEQLAEFDKRSQRRLEHMQERLQDWQDDDDRS